MWRIVTQCKCGYNKEIERLEFHMQLHVAIVRALCAFLSCSFLATTVFTYVFIEQINDDDDIHQFSA